MARTSRFILAATISVLVAACGGSPDPLVAFEAHWQCDVQRQAFADLSAIDASLQEALGDAGLTVEDYEGFRLELAESASLRNQVAEEYDAYCTS